MFRAYPAHLQEVHFVFVYMRSLLSSLSHTLQVTVLCTGSEISSFLTGAQDSHLQRVTIPETACIQLRSGPHEDEQGMLEKSRGF
jgi:hypothetical protein